MPSFCQSYIDDINENNVTRCKILLPFLSFSEFTEIKELHQNFQLHAFREENEIRVMIDRIIPNTLIEDLKTGEKSSMNFLLGYINDVLPIINKYILNRKYGSAHILGRVLTVQDIKWISIANLKNDEKFLVPWPIPFPDFPYEVDLEKYDFIYVRDLIDAMTSYINFDFNEVPRKIITSLENAFVHYKIEKQLKMLMVQKDKSILRKIILFFRPPKINFLFMVDAVVGRSELVHNLRIIYKTRNKLVHDKLRLSHNNDAMCHKSIGTLLWVYKGFLSESQEMSDYILKMEFQFGFIKDFYRGMKIEDFVIKHKNLKIFSGPDPELDDLMFGGLKIQDSEIPY
jgi:hypothetical protein